MHGDFTKSASHLKLNVMVNQKDKLNSKKNSK